MKQFFYLSTFCVLALVSCTESFKKGGGGLEYKIISGGGSGKTVSYGNFLQLHFTQRYKGEKDTIIGDSHDFMPRINVLDSVSTPPEYFNILKQVRIGDSVVLRTLVDSFYKRSPDQMPKYMKKGKYIYTSLKIVNIFETKDQADSANKAELIINRPRMFAKQLEQIEKEVLGKNKAQFDTDDKQIREYLAKNNINATKTKWGVYISTITEGTGPTLTYTDVASVNYTGRTLDSGRVFDSNIDPKFKHTEPLQVNIIEVDRIFLGWTDALLHMKQGTKATVYMPSTLGCGTEGRAPEIGPNTILIFDMEVVKAENHDEMMAKQEEMQKKMLEVQKHTSDSLLKAQQLDKK